MATAPVTPPARHIEFKKGGWGAAILTTLAAIGAYLGAFWIHQQTYKHPRDVMMRAKGVEAHAPAAAGAAGTPAAEHGEH